MTERYAASWDEVKFMGPANPHITRFTILSDNSRTKDEASVSVRTFQGSGDSPADSYTVDTFVVLKQGSKSGWSTAGNKGRRHPSRGPLPSRSST